MCGIAGILTSGYDRVADGEAVRQMCAFMVHRGPDDAGLFTDGPVALGHRRLSIIDLRPEAAQPMTNEDGSIALIINGEIYNFQHLRSELEAADHQFRSRADSEVVLHLYEEFGLDFVDQLRGMFALALWDSRKKRLILARDRFGKKPLFYYPGARGLIFASEIQALARADLIPREPDLEAIDSYLALQYVPAPLTIYQGVRKLPPGHLMVCSPGKDVKPEPYFKLRFDRSDDRPISVLSAELRERIEESVRIRMVADVPIGAFLSGGIDSSLVVACMARASTQRVQTFSIGFPHGGHSELAWAREVAKRYRTEHHELVVEPDMVSIVQDLALHYGEPYGDTSAIPTWYLSRFTRQSVTVALSGDAGDEAFAGYKRYRFARISRLLRRLPWPIPQLVAAFFGRIPVPQLQPTRDFGRRLMQPEVIRYLGMFGQFSHDERREIYLPDLKRRFSSDRVAAGFQQILDSSTATDAVGRLLDLDIQTYLPDDILVKVDIAAMAHSLEVRCPLLDHELMSFAASVPSNKKLRGFSSKAVLRAAVTGLVPESILNRPKQGFGLPIDRWMREDLAPMARDILLDQTATNRGLFDPLAI